MQYSFYPKVLGVVIKENIKFVSSLQRRDKFDIFFKCVFCELLLCFDE